jgi:hypothetical protein
LPRDSQCHAQSQGITLNPATSTRQGISPDPGAVLAETNDNHRPFVKTANPDKIVVAVSRGYQAIDSIHSHVRHFKMQARKFLAFSSGCPAWPPLGRTGGTILKRRLIML